MNIHEIIKTCRNYIKYTITLPFDTAWMSTSASTYWKTFSDSFSNNRYFILVVLSAKYSVVQFPWQPSMADAESCKVQKSLIS